MTTVQASHVHLVRHGEVRNPDGILYGQLPGFHLSQTGLAMADRLGEWFAKFPLTHLRTSPLERAQETLAPIHQAFPEADFAVDPRVIEADNKLAGQVFGARNAALWKPSNWPLFRNPLRPSWGEPFEEIADRMILAVNDLAGSLEPGHDGVIVSHQLPIWMARLRAEGKPLAHIPTSRQCTLASVTSFRYEQGALVGVTYAEPARDLLRGSGNEAFSSGS